MNKLIQNLSHRTLNFKVLMSIAIITLLTRMAIPPFITHLPNFSSVSAMALFFGAYCSRQFFASSVVVLLIWISDLFLNKMLMGTWIMFYPGCCWQYGCYLLMTLLGGFILKNKKFNLYRLTSTSLLSAILFFLISNFGVWYSGLLYPLTMDGLMTCYINALPFVKNTLVSNVFFTLAWFMIFDWINQGEILKSASSTVSSSTAS